MITAIWGLLAVAGADEPKENRSIARAAEWFLEHRPSLSREDCSGLVSDILNRAGQEVYGTVTTIVDWSRELGWFHARPVAHVGDIVFFDRTYDSNRNGRPDDRFTHIGVVTAVDEDGTIHMVHRSSSRGIAPLRMNLNMPDTYKLGDRVVNDYLVRKTYAGERGPRLTGQVWSGFASAWWSGPTEPADAPQAVVASKSTQAAKEKPSPRRQGRESRKNGQLKRTATAFRIERPAPTLVARVLYGAELSPSDLAVTGCDELWWLRNAVYARHGYAFTTPDARSVFDAEPWYVRDLSVSENNAPSLLSPADRHNVSLLVQVERTRCR